MQGSPRSYDWHSVMVNGASRHMMGTLALFKNVKPIKGRYVGFVGNHGENIIGQRTLSNGIVMFDTFNYITKLENPPLVTVGMDTSSVMRCGLSDARFSYKNGFVNPNTPKHFLNHFGRILWVNREILESWRVRGVLGFI